jgi:hypothetical protein
MLLWWSLQRTPTPNEIRGDVRCQVLRRIWCCCDDRCSAPQPRQKSGETYATRCCASLTRLARGVSGREEIVDSSAANAAH